MLDERGWGQGVGHGHTTVNRALGELGRTAFDWPERVREFEEGWRHSCVCERETCGL